MNSPGKTGMLAFYPWLRIKSRCAVGPLELIPYETEKAAQFPSAVEQVLAPYKHSGGGRCETATLIKFASRELTDTLSDSQRSEIFNLTEIMAFASLADREFFSHGGYMNKDNYACVIQGFREGSSGVAITARRRDGETTAYFPAEIYEVRCPSHVSIKELPATNTLTASLIKAYATPQWEKYDEAIQSYNRANTDSSQTSEQHEFVSLVGAFERLFQLPWGKEAALAQALKSSTETLGLPPSSPCDRLKSNEFYEKGNSVSEMWIRDLFQMRHTFAHGGTTLKESKLWTQLEHLLLGAFFFPLVVKIEMQRDGFYQLTDEDRRAVHTFTSLACCKKLFLDQRNPNGPDEFPWQKIISESRWAWISANLPADS